ncbi:unnamed protein product, partial [Amoebophrya sp. A25]
MHWINERQGKAEPPLLHTALELLQRLAGSSPANLDIVLQAGALQFLEDFVGGLGAEGDV